MKFALTLDGKNVCDLEFDKDGKCKIGLSEIYKSSQVRAHSSGGYRRSAGGSDSCGRIAGEIKMSKLLLVRIALA